MSIIINGKKYAATKKEFAESLFSSLTCSGFYKKLKSGIRLADHQGNVFAFIYDNGRNNQGIVSCRKHGNGYQYMQSTMTQDEKLLGYPEGLRYKANVELAEYVLEIVFPDKYQPVIL